LSENVLQERENLCVRLLRGDFAIVDRRAPFETRIGWTKRLFRLNVDDNTTIDFGETAFATCETLRNFRHLCRRWPVEIVMRSRAVAAKVVSIRLSR
jgi:hypothetical protein